MYTICVFTFFVLIVQNTKFTDSFYRTLLKSSCTCIGYNNRACSLLRSYCTDVSGTNISNYIQIFILMIIIKSNKTAILKNHFNNIESAKIYNETLTDMCVSFLQPIQGNF